MKVLVACEFSGVVRDAFIRAGHDAMSCDLLPSESDFGPHYQGDIRDVLGERWDMMVAFPPCTYLTASNGFRWNDIAAERAEALDFVRFLMKQPIDRIAIENPSGAIGSFIRKADQYVNPWQFGDPFFKRTGLWLDGLPPLRPEIWTPLAGTKHWNQARYMVDGVRVSMGVARTGKDRSRTFPGIARAMAQQWGGLTVEAGCKTDSGQV